MYHVRAAAAQGEAAPPPPPSPAPSALLLQQQRPHCFEPQSPCWDHSALAMSADFVVKSKSV